MLLTLSTTHRPATDLGYLLHKNPSRLQSVELSCGVAHVFYPEASDEKCTVAVLVEIDPVKLVRGRRGPSGDGGRFDQYVNDRPYTANSYLSSALLEFFSTAMSGRSKERQALAETPIPLSIEIAVIASRGGEGFLRSLFEPLGYAVEVERLTLDERFPEWGRGPYFSAKLVTTQRLSQVLSHLYVLIPVLDDDKHYWVDATEIDKLLSRGKEWLPAHPSREEITRRYLRRQTYLTRDALARLTALDGDADPDERVEVSDSNEEQIERPISLHQERLESVVRALKESGARSVVDLGCGEGKLIRLLMKEKQFERIVGMDVAFSMLERAHRGLRLDGLPSNQASRLELLHGSVLYRDSRLRGFDAAAVVEVIEHLDPERLKAFERVVFQFAKPGLVVVTTPNCEYNGLFESLPAGQFRHRDHRFEWSRAEFRAWAQAISEQFGYSWTSSEIGPIDATVGSPSQMAVFTREASA